MGDWIGHFLVGALAGHALNAWLWPWAYPRIFKMPWKAGLFEAVVIDLLIFGSLYIGDPPKASSVGFWAAITAYDAWRWWNSDDNDWPKRKRRQIAALPKKFREKIAALTPTPAFPATARTARAL